MSNQRDYNELPYPSVEGAMQQSLDALEEPNDFSWYSFHAEEDGSFRAVSYDEAGEPDRVYTFRIFLEGSDD